MQLSSEFIERLKEEIRIKENGVKKIENITRYPNTEDLEPLNGHEFSDALTRNASAHTLKFVSPKSLCVKYVRTIFPTPPPIRERNTPPVTYPEEVEETLGTPIEVETLDETQLEDLGLNICNHDLPLSSKEVPVFDEPEPQPQPLPNYTP
ncbi:hypothetical protein Tco_0629879 [Tanacetum coccineum]|uniref:Uncharacterized protein n=1 Tax=Tanacetum coccineum TaxID=301880 RepID=A0ABQ4WUF4_9ASTR